jgi:uncharacterized membrane protein YjgN (DUF898 family)
VAQDEIPPNPDRLPNPTTPPNVFPGYPGVYPEESQAVVALTLSVIGLVVCGGLLCPVGWYLANKEIAAIDAGRRDPSKRDTAQAGKIVGIIGTALTVLAVVAFVGFIVLAIAISASSS